MYCGVYNFDAYSFECTGVFTNMTPTDAYRGAGRPEAAYAIERIMDSLAQELDMDPVEVRRKNFYEPFDEPTTTPAGIQYDSLNLQVVLDRALELADYEALERRAAAQAREGRPRPARHRALDVHGDLRPRPLPGLAALRYGSAGLGVGEGAGCSAPARSRS